MPKQLLRAFGAFQISRRFGPQVAELESARRRGVFDLTCLVKHRGCGFAGVIGNPLQVHRAWRVLINPYAANPLPAQLLEALGKLPVALPTA
jgi:hypothetical protein